MHQAESSCNLREKNKSSRKQLNLRKREREGQDGAKSKSGPETLRAKREIPVKLIDAQVFHFSLQFH